MYKSRKSDKGKNAFLVAGVFLLLMAMTLFSCQSGKEKEHAHQENTTYTCPMHPQVVQEEPGSCPICGMDLVPVNPEGDNTAISDNLKYLLQPVDKTVVSDIRAVSPVKKQMETGIQAKGIIAYDPRRIHTIPVRFGGRIEKLYVNYNFEPIQKGQKIMEIYSPEIVTAQQELLYLLKSDPENKSLIEASKQKLRLLGLTDAQINRLIKTGETSYSLAVYSPYSGYIYEEAAATPALQMAEPQAASGDGMGNMGATTTAAPSSASAMPSQTRLGIREGMYLNRGEATFKVVNTDKVWAEFNMYPATARYVKKGDSVTIIPDFNKELSLKAKVDFVQPFYQDGENFTKVRVYLNNPENKFLPGQLVTAKFSGKSERSLWIPATAVLDLGTKKVVFVKKGEVFHPQVVATGRVSGDLTEVVSGLSVTDSIADNGHFLVDSEGFVKIREKNRE